MKVVLLDGGPIVRAATRAVLEEVQTLKLKAAECGAVGHLPKSASEEELAQQVWRFAGVTPRP